MASALYEREAGEQSVQEVKYYSDGGMAIRINGAWRDGTSLPTIALDKWFYRWGDNVYIADADEVSLVCRGNGLEIVPK